MLTNIGLSANKVHDDDRINHAKDDGYGQPNHQHKPAIQHTQSAMKMSQTKKKL